MVVVVVVMYQYRDVEFFAASCHLNIVYSLIFVCVCIYTAFSALTLLVWRQEEHRPRKKL